MSLPLLDRAHFDGPDFVPALDRRRLAGHIERIYALMRDGQWRTLREIADLTHGPEPSVSAHLRHLRKQRFGGHEVQKRRRGEPSTGLYEYRLVVEAPDVTA